MRPPSQDELAAIAGSFGLKLSAAELADLTRLCAGMQAAYDCLDRHEPARLPVLFPRDGGEPPRGKDNPFHAWAWLTDIRGAPDGPLAGRRVAIKDNIAVAGVPMRNGSALLAGFVPDEDASVVSRILAAGGSIAGKTVCEDLCFSGSSHTSTPLPVLNPWDTARAAGGSSSGNAAAIAAGDVSMAVGGDQGGSVRTPASWCGIVGLKPTHGLVPYTGAFPIEPSFDHLGPMGATVKDVALLLSVIAGPDGLDHRQQDVTVQDYLAAVDSPVEGLRIGVLREGFGRPESDPESDAVVRSALGRLAAAGAILEEVSLPWHLDAYQIGSIAIFEGAADFLYAGNITGSGFNGHVSEKMARHWAGAWRENPDALPAIGKFALLFGAYLRQSGQTGSYAKAQNLRRAIRAAYDGLLERHDVIAMPTMPFPAPLLPRPGATLGETVTAGLDMEGNTAPFDASGHPAITVPCGLCRGLPVGLMFAGRHSDERNVLRAAASFERLGDWKQF
ncbi:amidase [Aestuariivirga sp.]|uniref:amidase n=1 Tax=Aestuariivirga sp. TaxID=2650926 RepID=UPI00391D0EAE